MPLPAPEIERLLRERFPDAEIRLEDLAGDNDHFSLWISCETFRGKSRVEQHRMVYDALQGKMGGVLHALAVTTAVPPA